MNRRFITIALGLLAAIGTSSVIADSTPAPPEWNDGASVYLAKSQATTAVNSTQEASSTQGPLAPIRMETNQGAGVTATFQDPAVMPAIHETQPPTNSDTSNRRLAPPSKSGLYSLTAGRDESASGSSRKILDFGLPTQSIYTIVSALAIVVGAFLIFAWAMRRGTKRSSAVLPAEVASVLGRVPLAARQFAELLRVGNKLVLVSLTPNGAETLTEVTDPVEVDRLLSLCQQYDPHSTTKAFEQVFQQLSSDPGRGGFLGEDSLPTSLSPIAGAYRAQRGVTTRA